MYINKVCISDSEIVGYKKRVNEVIKDYIQHIIALLYAYILHILPHTKYEIKIKHEIKIASKVSLWYGNHNINYHNRMW